MSENNNKGGETIAAVIMIAIVVLFIALGVATCNSESSIDVVHDPNGFMGYSDDFWEWMADQ